MVRSRATSYHKEQVLEIQWKLLDDEEGTQTQKLRRYFLGIIISVYADISRLSKTLDFLVILVKLKSQKTKNKNTTKCDLPDTKVIQLGKLHVKIISRL